MLQQTTNMKYLAVFCATIVFVSEYCEGQSGQISSKLDFGSSDTSSKDFDSTLSSSVVKALISLQTTNTQKSLISSKLDQNPFNLRSIAPLADQNTKTEITSLEVICVDGKCNTTKKNADTGDKLSTDIVVKVMTNVDNKEENKTVAAGEADDVPIVVGYAGTNMKPNGLEPASVSVDGTQDITITTGTDDTSNNVHNTYHMGNNDVVPQYHNNHFPHQVPHFEPTYNNHYFGESPPPQFVWHRRRNDLNLHAFNNRPSFKPNQWQLKYPNGIPQNNMAPGWTQTTTCSCTNPGLNWYPSFGPHLPTPAAPVNDKMDPLRK